MFALTERVPHKKDQEHIFRKDVIRIGRSEKCDLPLRDAAVSSMHAEITRFGEDYFIRDLDSRNGIVVNEERVRERALENGDHVLLGKTLLIFQYRRRSSDTDVKRLIFQTVEDVISPTRPVSDTTIAKQTKEEESATGTIVLERGDQEQNDLVQMANWCSQRQLLERALELVGEHLVFQAASILFRDQLGNLHRAAWKHPSNPEVEPVFDIETVRLLDVDEPGVLVADAQADPRLAALCALPEFKAHSVAVASFPCGRNGFGMIYVERAKEHPALQFGDLKTVMAISAKVATGLEALWSLSRERELKPDCAEALQLHLKLVQEAFQSADSNSCRIQEALKEGDLAAVRSAWEILRASLDQVAVHLELAQTELAEKD